jgi:hypothetical protein
MHNSSYNKWLKTDSRHQGAAHVTKGGASRLAERYAQMEIHRISRELKE